MKIQIGFSKNKGFSPVSWAIMATERTNFSHVFMEFYSKSLDRHLIYHATGSGVSFIGKPIFEEHNIIVDSMEIEVSEESHKKLLQWCVDQAGKPYSYVQAITIGLRRLCGFIGIKLGPILKNKTQAYICSELIACVLRELNYPTNDEDIDSIGLVETKKLLDIIR